MCLCTSSWAGANGLAVWSGTWKEQDCKLGERGNLGVCGWNSLTGEKSHEFICDLC